MFSKEKIVQGIKDAGQSLIDNAGSIAGDYEYLSSIGIHIDLDANERYMPKINTSIDFYPERYMEDLKGRAKSQENEEEL